jgi:hypothetical protein
MATLFPFKIGAALIQILKQTSSALASLKPVIIEQNCWKIKYTTGGINSSVFPSDEHCFQFLSLSCRM